MKFEFPFGATPLDPNSMAGLIPDLQTQAELNEFEQLNIATSEAWALKSRKLKKDLLSVLSLEDLHRRMFDKTWKY